MLNTICVGSTIPKVPPSRRFHHPEGTFGHKMRGLWSRECNDDDPIRTLYLTPVNLRERVMTMTLTYLGDNLNGDKPVRALYLTPVSLREHVMTTTLTYLGDSLNSDEPIRALYLTPVNLRERVMTTTLTYLGDSLNSGEPIRTVPNTKSA
ncbi:hypothetical protein FIBSPDRAFT_902745 [Athelia psychrophila]|uniref:Uncharacterized protein n=1 Tax=Athelia psychrophila TaxID=1759441 RepID=A0A167WUU5_9AGAM|nr:hypothetical protein FIBSPDRAFT_902745 [Fibularhizoctonia sp. CBS 109695]